MIACHSLVGSEQPNQSIGYFIFSNIVNAPGGNVLSQPLDI